jgi:hypothetical protein
VDIEGVVVAVPDGGATGVVEAWTSIMDELFPLVVIAAGAVVELTGFGASRAGAACTVPTDVGSDAGTGELSCA